MLYFPFFEYWFLYVGFALFVLALVLLDMGVVSRKKQVLTSKEAWAWSAGWISLGLLLGLVIWFYTTQKFGAAIGKELTLEYYSGFLIEKALAVDNIFVFVLIFTSLKISPAYQKTVLGYGILGALIFRAIFISIGALLMQYQFMLYVFGGFLLITGIKMAFPTKEEVKLKDGIMYKFLSRVLPLTEKTEGGSFWIHENGKLFFTPLFLALVLIELSDIVFAIDSVPAIFAITKEPFIVFTSNMMAILGLRSLYLVLADAVERFEYLKYGLSAILIFVGLKMVWLNQMYGGHFPISISLAVIALILAVSIGASLYRTRPNVK